jgi:hypothetical protein
MGQYYVVVNTTKRQYLRPATFGNQAKLDGVTRPADGIMTGLGVLLADGNGNGDWTAQGLPSLYGSWAGDAIVLAGDYGTKGLHVSVEDEATYRTRCGTEAVGPDRPRLYHVALELFEDVSERVVVALCEDEGMRRSLKQDLWRRADVSPRIRQALQR